MSEIGRDCELPKSQCWSNSNGKLRGRRKNYHKFPVLKAKLVSDQAEEPTRNDTVNRKSKKTVMPNPRLQLVFQPPLDSDKKLFSKKENPQESKYHDFKFKISSIPACYQKNRKASLKKENQRQPVIAGQFDNADDDNNNLLQSIGSVLEDLSMTEHNITGEKASENFIDNTTSIESLLHTVGQTLPETVEFYPVKRLGDLCRGLLGSRLVCLLNSDDGGSLLVGVDEDHCAPGLRLTRGERDKIRQLLDSVCHDNIDPAVRAKHVDIEFIPVNTDTFKDTFVIKITVIMSEILKMCNFKLKGLKAKGYEDGIYKLSGYNQSDSVCESAYYSA